MKFKLIVFLIATSFFLSCNKKTFIWTSDYDVSVMSFNIRYDEPADGVNKWSNRKEAVLKMWKEINPSIVGIQEGLNHQVIFLDDSLSQYDFVGVGRDNGQTSGEYAAIYYKKNDFELLESNTFWLSETPEVPSLGWDANNTRITTWAHFKDLNHGKSIYVFNTHFDHKGKTARKEAAKLLVQKIKEIATDDAPIFVIGDFNARIRNKIFKPIKNEYFSARKFAEKTDKRNSFNLWGKWYAKWSVDYIFYKNAHALAFRTVTKNYGVPYISDHYPLITHFNYLD